MADKKKYEPPRAVRLTDAETAKGNCTQTGGFEVLDCYPTGSTD